MDKDNYVLYRASIYIDYKVNIGERRHEKYQKLLKKVERVISAMSNKIEVTSVTDFDPVQYRNGKLYGLHDRPENFKYLEELPVNLPKTKTSGGSD